MEIIDNLKLLFYNRAPNTLLEEHILLEFQEVPEDSLKNALALLVAEGFLDKTVLPPNPRCKFLKRTVYRISENSLGDYPIRTEIEAAGIRVPRLIDGDKARAEDVNSLIYAVNKIIEVRTKQLEQQMEEQSRKYWGALVTIFALFVSLFSIINVGVKPVLFASELALSPADLIFQSLLNIGPLAIVLLLFVWLLHRILRK